MVVGGCGGGAGGSVCVCVHACVHVCIYVCMCVCVWYPVSVHGAREQLRKRETSKGKFTWKKVPRMDSNLQPCACGPTVLTLYYCQVLIGINRWYIYNRALHSLAS